MTLSIIVPVYNTEKYLDKCINSLLSQTYKDLEFILVNDGSTDNSLKILNNYAHIDERIIIVNQNNVGLSGARNAGLKIAKGSYIMFLDSDDWIENDTCEIAMKKIALENADIIFWSYKREYDNKSINNYIFGTNELIWDEKNIKFLHRRIVGLVDEELSEPQKLDSIVTVWGKIYKRDIIQNISFIDTKIIGTEDALFNIYAFENVKKAVYIPDCLSHYRKTVINSLTHNYKSNLVFQWKNLYKEIFSFLKKQNKSEDYFIALQNRISLGLIGLGINLVEDKKLGVNNQITILHSILAMPHYQDSLNQLKLNYFPIHWKIFFFSLKKEYVFMAICMLKLMNYLRKYK